MKFFKVFSLLVCYFILINVTPTLAQKTSLQTLQKKIKQYQANSDYPMIAKTLEEMLANGYKSAKRYKQLGDLYFFIKKDKKALDTFRAQARWANTAEMWEKLSDLLIWKKHNKEGRKALETAYALAPRDEKVIAKLAGVYEYQKLIKKSEKLWKLLWRQNKTDISKIENLINFYLRNKKLNDAKKLLTTSFTSKELEKTPLKFRITAMKIFSWSNQIKDSHKVLKSVKVENIPQKELGYFFIIAKLSSDYDYLEAILDRMEDAGQDVYKRKLEISVFKNSPEKTRELIEERIDEKGENPKLLFDLYKTYRAQRKVEGGIEVLEELVPLDFQNPMWYRMLLKYYDYTHDYDRGIDVLEDIVDEHEDDAQVALLYLAELYLKSQELEDFEETIERIDQPDLIAYANSLKYKNAEFSRKSQILYDIQVSSLKEIPNISPEDQYLAKTKKGKYQQVVENDLPDDRYLGTLEALSFLAGDLNKSDESLLYGKKAYAVLKDRFTKYPTKNRLIMLILKGEIYGTAKEQEDVFVKGEHHLKDTFFYLKYYRFLMREKRYADAEIVLAKLLKSPTNLGERYQIAEHTFGYLTLDLSEKLFKEIIKSDKNYSMGLKRLGQIALYTSNYPTAIFYIKKYLNINAFDSESIFLLGEAFHFNRQPFKAADQFNRLIDLLDYPGISEYENELVALSYLRLGDIEKALVALKKLYKKNPDKLSTKINIVETLVLLKKWQESLDFIEKEKLDDEERLYSAKNKVSHSEYFKDNVYKDNSTVKSKLKHEELIAIINVELGMRIQFIKHLCLNGLGRVHEDEILLENLYRKNKQNKDLLSTIGFYHLGKGEDTKGLVFLKKATRIPPYDVALNAYVREVKYSYSPKFFTEYYNTTVTGEKGKEQTGHHFMIGGQTTVIEKDHFKYHFKYIKLDQEDVVETSTDSGTQEYEEIGIGYNGFLPFYEPLGVIQKYKIDLNYQKETGQALTYFLSTQESKISGALSIQNNIPNADSYEMLKSNARTTGYGIEFGLQATELRQSYSLIFDDKTYHFKDYFFRNTQTESSLKVGFSQYLMHYPHSLTLLAVYSDKQVDGTVTYIESSNNSTTYKHLVLPSTLLEYGVIYNHDWNEFLSFDFSLINVIGKYKEFESSNRFDSDQNINNTNIKVTSSYIDSDFSLTGFLNYTIERLGDKTEWVMSSANTNAIESDIDAREVTTLKIGLKLEKVF